MSENIISRLDLLISHTREDNIRLDERIKNAKRDLDARPKPKTIEDYVIKFDILNGMLLAQSTAIINQRLEALLKLGKTLTTNMDNLTNALSKLPDRQEFDDVKKSLQSDRLMYLEAFKEIKEGLDSQKKQETEQKDDTKKQDEEKAKLMDELRKKQGERAFG